MIPYTKSDKKLMELIDTGIIELRPIDFYFSDFDIQESKAKHLFTHIGSGIGDILALSAVTDYLITEGYTVTVFAPENKHAIFDWFEHRPILKKYFDPIVLDVSPQDRLLRLKTVNRLRLEMAAVEAREQCWYDAQFRRMGFDKAPEGFNRPKLSVTGVFRTDTMIEHAKNVLICHRASCQMRSSNFEDFYKPVKEVYPDHHVYVHETDLTEKDRQFIETLEDVTVLPKCSLDDYLINLFDAQMVVTTDSSAIHFREGLELPALGVYGAMTTESRVSGYKFTRSFNVKSSCQHQPCFIHERVKGQVCLNAKEGDRVAKCQTGKAFQNQLEKELRK